MEALQEIAPSYPIQFGGDNIVAGWHWAIPWTTSAFTTDKIKLNLSHSIQSLDNPVVPVFAIVIHGNLRSRRLKPVEISHCGAWALFWVLCKSSGSRRWHSSFWCIHYSGQPLAHTSTWAIGCAISPICHIWIRVCFHTVIPHLLLAMKGLAVTCLKFFRGEFHDQATHWHCKRAVMKRLFMDSVPPKMLILTTLSTSKWSKLFDSIPHSWIMEVAVYLFQEWSWSGKSTLSSRTSPLRVVGNGKVCHMRSYAEFSWDHQLESWESMIHIV